MDANIFTRIADIALGANQRKLKEHREMLDFYRRIVETVPTEVAEMFGSMPVKVRQKNIKDFVTWNIELTATDYLWWRRSIENEGARFASGAKRIMSAMLEQMTKNIGTLEPEERKALIKLMDEAE